MDKVIHLEIEPEGIAWLNMLDERNNNALSERFVKSLTENLAEVGENKNIKVMILSGLQEMFCSGASKDLLADITEGNIPTTEITLARHLLSLPIPVIAAAEGSAIGGGFALALAADMVLLAKESRYGANFISLGFTPGMGMTKFLEHCMSPAIANELLYTGELRKGDKFSEVGGINAVLPRKEVRGKAFDIALRIAEHPRESISILKRTLSLPRRRLFEETLTLESLMHNISFNNYDPSSY